MAVKDVFKVTRKTFFNPSGWFGYELFKQNTNYVWSLVSSVFTLPATTETTAAPLTFEEAMQKNNVTPAALEELRKDYLMYAVIFLLLTGTALFFCFYIASTYKTWSGLFIGIVVAMLFASQAFRFHFWYFQITTRKLGCTFNDWWQYVLGRSRPAS